MKFVSCFAGAVPVTGRVHTFCVPLRSETKNTALPSAAHIGHISLAPPLVTGWYCGVAPSRAIHTSASSRWLRPLRHHWPDAVARALIASAEPFGASLEKYSFVYRSPATAIGVPPSALTRNTSFMPAMS